jgi:flagellar hook-associated protein 3 FlgL
MIRSFDPASEQFLTSLEAAGRRISQAMQEISTGYRVSRPSDAPADVVSILRIEGDMRAADQVQSNLGRLKNEVDTAESTIQIAINILDQAVVFSAQALGLQQNAETRAAIATQVRDLQQQIVSLTRLNVQGRYVFSGDNDQAPQYTLDPANIVTGVSRNFQTAETRQITDVLGASFSAALTAEQLFDHRNPDDSVALDNVFAALEQLVQGLSTNDSAVIEQAAASIKTASGWLNSNLSFYGAVQKRISNSLAIAAKYQVQWQQQLSDKRDTDYAEAITALEASRTTQSAALGARARFAGISLFDFLK